MITHDKGGSSREKRTRQDLLTLHRQKGGVVKIGGMHIRRLFLLALTPLVLSACAAAPQFTPQTLEGARCKLECVDRSWGIVGTSYSRCLEACMDLDRVYQARQATPK